MGLIILALLGLWLARLSEGVMILGIVLVLMAGLEGIFLISVHHLVSQLDVLSSF